MNETSAINLCLRHQDPRGFEYLVEKYRREAYFHAISLLGDQEDAADICQEAFTRAFVAIPKLTGLDRFYPWFYQILRNCCLNLLSRKKIASRYCRENKRQEADTSERTSPSFLLEQKEEQGTIWQALRELKPEFREILLMKYIDNCSYDEISQNLQIPRGTVMSRLYHARRAFKDRYLEEVER